MKERTVKILIQVLIWSAFLVFLFLFMPFYDVQLFKMPYFFLASYALLIGYYYFNSGFLVPRFLGQGKIFVFIFVTLIILFLYIYLSDALGWMQPHETKPGGGGMNLPPPRGTKPPEDIFGISPVPEGMERDMQPPGTAGGIWRHFRPGTPRNMFPMSSMLTFILVFMVSTGTRIITSWFVLERQKNQAQHEKSLAELSALKAQLNPHFLFNTLNSLYYLARKKADSTPDMILKLSSLMRFVLTETKAGLISLEKEVECIQEYIDLQRLRLTDKTEVVFTKEGELNDQQIAPLLLLPLVENAFKFGVSSRTNSTIFINLTLQQDKLTFIVKNGKVNSVTESESTGIGLKNVRQRLSLIYPEKHAFMIQETDNLFSAELKIILS